MTTPIGIVLCPRRDLRLDDHGGRQPGRPDRAQLAVLVFLGTFGASVAGITMGDAKKIFTVMLVAMKGKVA